MSIYSSGRAAPVKSRTIGPVSTIGAVSTIRASGTTGDREIHDLGASNASDGHFGIPAGLAGGHSTYGQAGSIRRILGDR